MRARLRSRSWIRIAADAILGRSGVTLMVRIAVRSPGLAEPESLELAVGEQALLGRRPRREAAASGSTASLRTIEIADPSVSASHLLVECRSDGVRLVDLHSRNGSSLRLPAGADVSVRESTELAIELSPRAAAGAQAELPDDASFVGPSDFDLAVVKSVERWCAARDLPLRIRLERPAPGARRERLGTIPLPTGSLLALDAVGTVGSAFVDAVVELERYVVRQSTRLAIEEDARADGMIVASPAMRECLARVVEAAASGMRSVLLTGPSGSGKEGLARCFHRHTGRPGPFVARNCGLFQKELVRSELFGAEKGSFSGCVQRITGAVEAANGGTLFLDELAELPKEVQPMLLRFLDHGEYERMGRYGKPSTSDVRIVAATHGDLRAAALRDDFRMDLWFRLSVSVIEVPPLRQRFEDVVAYLVQRPAPNGGSLHDRLEPAALELLEGHRWDGNFRELVNFAERISLLARRGPIDADACHRALEEGALRPVERPKSGSAPRPSEPPPSGWEAVLARATASYVEDHARATPRTWDDVKDFVENYLKPHGFAHLSGAEQAASLAEVDLKAAAQRLAADRGTAQKQLERYFDRLRGGGES